MEDHQGGGQMTLWTGVGAHSQRQLDWQTTDNRGKESLASAAHMGCELMMQLQLFCTDRIGSNIHAVRWLVDLTQDTSRNHSFRIAVVKIVKSGQLHHAHHTEHHRNNAKI